MWDVRLEWNTWGFGMIAKEQCEDFYPVVKPNFWEPPCWACRTLSSLRSASNPCSSPGAAAVSTSPSAPSCLHTTLGHQTYLPHVASGACAVTVFVRSPVDARRPPISHHVRKVNINGVVRMSDDVWSRFFIRRAWCERHLQIKCFQCLSSHWLLVLRR